MKNSRDTVAWGVFLVIIGVLFLVGNLSPYGLEFVWPFFPLAVGVAFILKYLFSRKSVAGLMPGTVLIIVSLLLLFCNIFGWYHMESLWPVFILAPAAGFFVLYLAGNKDRSNIVSGSILTGIGGVFLLAYSRFGEYWPVLLIVVGLILMASGWRVRNRAQEEGPASDS